MIEIDLVGLKISNMILYFTNVILNCSKTFLTPRNDGEGCDFRAYLARRYISHQFPLFYQCRSDCCNIGIISYLITQFKIESIIEETRRAGALNDLIYIAQV